MNINHNCIQDSHVVVRSFDGSRRDTVGEIELLVEIGPYTFDISFQVLNITTGYNLLTRRPWIHTTAAVPSTLHQQLKYIVNGNLVTVSAKRDYPIVMDRSIPIIGVDESIEPASFQAFEISTTNYRPLGTPALKPKVSLEVMLVAQEMMSKKFQPGQGLRKNGQGIRYSIQLPT